MNILFNFQEEENRGCNFFKWFEVEPSGIGLPCSYKDDVDRIMNEITKLKNLLKITIKVKGTYF